MVLGNDRGCAGFQGWEAIDQTLAGLHPGGRPVHWGPAVRWREGGSEPLDGVVCYAGSGSPPHWHYTSFGLSEIYGKETDNPAISGLGLELTFRLACGARDFEPPVWPVHLLQVLARYIFNESRVPSPGDYLDLNGPMLDGSGSQIRVALFTQDAQLPAISTPNGRVTFLQVVGATSDELHAAQAWDLPRFLAMLRISNPLLVTDLSRRSHLHDPHTMRAVRGHMRREGSTAVELRSESARWDIVAGGTRLRMTIGAKGVQGLKMLLFGRTLHGRSFHLIGPQSAIHIEPGDAIAWKSVDGGSMLRLTLPSPVAERLSRQLRPRRTNGPQPAAAGLEVNIVPSPINDEQGRVIEQFGV